MSFPQPIPSGARRASSAGPAVRADGLAALREATREQHARLDAALPLARDGATLQDYVRHARALAAWLQALGPVIAPIDAGAHPWRLDDPDRLQALRRDLEDAAAVGWPTVGVATKEAADRVLERFPARAQAIAWGMAYVVEGSQLGGQWLHRRLSATLAPHPLRYLQGSGPGTAARWKHFLARLADALRTPEDIAAACAGAQAAFDALQRQYDAQEETPA